ncbi:histidine phosphatase family protein [Nocardioides sp.]|uniref:SixA phosphatase family protein n=1 Tax=Nocardioides sp. TaxID=35761 RepID=UPI0026078E89|nr:histidine phosphatase family protein [Nocardioides sp.]
MTSSDPAPARRRLVLVRHAKAEAWGEDDHARLLTEKGRADASEAGRWLAESGFVPDRALVSSATRARETWSLMSEAAGWELAPVIEPALFAASPDTVLDLLREAPADARSVMVVGHNPTIAYLAQLLDDGGGDAAASAAMVGGYPPCAMTVFDVVDAWTDLEFASASLRAFRAGRS